MRVFVFLFFLFLASCSLLSDSDESSDQAQLTLHQTDFSNLPGWRNDGFDGFGVAFERSCKIVFAKQPDIPVGTLPEAGTYGDWQKICKDFGVLDQSVPETLRAFFETHFMPYVVSADDDPVGLFTGYYEASLRGSYTKKAPYLYPLHRRPDDLVMVQLGDFREDLKGRRIAGRVKDGRLRPYEERNTITAGNWPHHDNILVWVDSPVDAFFVQIQGSGVVQMGDGSVLRIGYDGQNGHPYYAIGRELIKTGALTKDNVSMQSIRDWLERHPDQSEAIMNTNKSYVFFREIKGEGPLGAQGVALTPERSLAVDHSFIPYGVPLWVDLEAPVKNMESIRRLMVVQDTGGAIRGPVRGDVFWGYGKEAETIAGGMKSKGRYWVLLPRKIQ